MKSAPDSVPEARLSVRLTPRASSNALLRFEDGVLHLRLTAPPVEGAANAACCAHVADLLGIRPAQVSVRHGHKSRDKILAVSGLSADAVGDRLAASV